MDTWGLTPKSLGLRSSGEIMAAKLSMEGISTVIGHSQTENVGLAHEHLGTTRMECRFEALRIF